MMAKDVCLNASGRDIYVDPSNRGQIMLLQFLAITWGVYDKNLASLIVFHAPLKLWTLATYMPF